MDGATGLAQLLLMLNQREGPPGEQAAAPLITPTAIQNAQKLLDHLSTGVSTPGNAASPASTGTANRERAPPRRPVGEAAEEAVAVDAEEAVPAEAAVEKKKKKGRGPDRHPEFRASGAGDVLRDALEHDLAEHEIKTGITKESYYTQLSVWVAMSQNSDISARFNETLRCAHCHARAHLLDFLTG